MSVAFKIKIKHQGSSQIDQYVGSDGKIVTEKIKGAIEDSVVNVAGRKIVETVKMERERTLFMAAVFFQRVVNRTPMDEDYLVTGENGSKVEHHADDDYVRDAWTASYNNRIVTAKQLREAGLTFENFNDENEIRKIYNVFKKTFVMSKKNILSIHIDNTHERFPMLEYGEYTKDSKEIKGGEKYEHGVEGGYSVQAPHGMLRITEAEFQTLTLNMSTKKLIKEYVQRSQRTTKVPSSAKMKELKKLILDKTHLYEKDLSAIERIYGV